MEAAPPASHGYADSVDSSPRSRNADSWDEPPLPPQVVQGAAPSKLRLMCSYGGHIVPRPHDKSLCYLGGDTRIVVVDRQLSLSDLSSKLSRTLLDGRPFTLKYQLPNEDLDSLISVTTDEDLENMVEEYDRTSTSVRPSRLRLFLFPSKPDSASSISSLLDDSKSETWFVDALNGGILPRGLSGDSNSVNCLLGLDDCGTVTSTDQEPHVVTSSNKPTKQEVHSVPDSPMLENSSSFGSTSSAPSLSNLPPIRVRAEGRACGIEDQFTQMMKLDDGTFMLGNLANNLPVGPVTVVPAVVLSPPGVPVENMNRVLSEDERSDPGLVRKPPQAPQKPNALETAPLETPSKDAQAISRPKPVIYQDTAPNPGRDRNQGIATVPQVPELKREQAEINYRVPVQTQDPGVVLSMASDQGQPQFIHAGAHYIHPSTGQVPLSYYQLHHPLQHAQHQQQVDPHYPMYYVPIRQNPVSMPPSQQAPLPTQQMVPPIYKDAPPVYQARTALPPKPEVYRTATAPATQPSLIHLSDTQHQYVSYHPTSGNFAYEYVDPMHPPQVYYTQPQTPATLASQYQTVASAAIPAEAVATPAVSPLDTKSIRTSQTQ